jgi:hypothetical protein
MSSGAGIASEYTRVRQVKGVGFEGVMGVGSQTVEDGIARRPPHTTLHFEGTAQEFIRVEMLVRRPWSLHHLDRRLVIRASQVTGEVTASLETLRTE